MMTIHETLRKFQIETVRVRSLSFELRFWSRLRDDLWWFKLEFFAI